MTARQVPVFLAVWTGRLNLIILRFSLDSRDVVPLIVLIVLGRTSVLNRSWAEQLTCSPCGP